MENWQRLIKPNEPKKTFLLSPNSGSATLLRPSKSAILPLLPHLPDTPTPRPARQREAALGCLPLCAALRRIPLIQPRQQKPPDTSLFSSACPPHAKSKIPIIPHNFCSQSTTYSKKSPNGDVFSLSPSPSSPEKSPPLCIARPALFPHIIPIPRNTNTTPIPALHLPKLGSFHNRLSLLLSDKTPITPPHPHTCTRQIRKLSLAPSPLPFHLLRTRPLPPWLILITNAL